MKYNVLSVSQMELLDNRSDLIEAATQDILLDPVRCIDCDTYVPFGWVEFGTVKCPKGQGYGHRMWTEGRTHVIDMKVNALLGIA